MMNFSARLPHSLAALVAGALALGTLTTGVHAQDLKIQHAKGETTVPAKPTKVIAFDLASLDTLNVLGVEVSGVPTARFP